MPARRVRKLKDDATPVEVVHAFNDMREGWIAWVLEQNHRDYLHETQEAATKEKLNEIAQALQDHAGAAKLAVEKLSVRVNDIEALPRKAVRWILVTVGGGVLVNVISNYFLHQYTAQKVDNAAAQAQRAAAVSTVTSTQVEKKIDNLTNAVESSPPTR